MFLYKYNHTFHHLIIYLCSHITKQSFTLSFCSVFINHTKLYLYILSCMFVCLSVCVSVCHTCVCLPLTGRCSSPQKLSVSGSLRQTFWSPKLFQTIFLLPKNLQNIFVDFQNFRKLKISLYCEPIFSCDSSSICALVGPSVCRSVCPSVRQQRVSRSIIK